MKIKKWVVLGLFKLKEIATGHFVAKDREEENEFVNVHTLSQITQLKTKQAYVARKRSLEETLDGFIQEKLTLNIREYLRIIDEIGECEFVLSFIENKSSTVQNIIKCSPVQISG